MNFLHDVFAGSKKAIPIVLGYLPLGFAYGTLARIAGLSLPYILMMSVLVYAGSGQFIAVSMLAAGADVLSIMITVFLVNLRYMLMSASLSTYLQKYTRKVLPLIGFWLTDESFTLASSELQAGERSHFFLLGLLGTAHLGWIVGGGLGGIFGGLFSSTQAAYTMEYALYAMFIFLLVLQCKRKKFILAAACAGSLSLVFYLLIPGNWYIIMATVITATFGVMMEKWKGLL